MNPPTLATTDEGLADALAKLEPYLERAREFGIDLRPITGLMLRLGDQFGIDLDAVGAVRQEGADQVPESYYDEMTRAIWLLAEREEVLAEVAGDEKAFAAALLRWKLKFFKTMEAEAAAMKGFIARWYEHRLEMARLYGAGDAAPADANG